MKQSFKNYHINNLKLSDFEDDDKICNRSEEVDLNF